MVVFSPKSCIMERPLVLLDKIFCYVSNNNEDVFIYKSIITRFLSKGHGLLNIVLCLWSMYVIVWKNETDPVISERIEKWT